MPRLTIETLDQAPDLFERGELFFLQSIDKGFLGEVAEINTRSVLTNVEAESFMDGRYTAKFSQRWSEVYDGELCIACIGYYFGVTVIPAYQRQGIAVELIYQLFRRFPNFPLIHKPRQRSTFGARTYVKAWERIKTEFFPNQGG